VSCCRTTLGTIGHRISDIQGVACIEVHRSVRRAAVHLADLAAGESERCVTLLAVKSIDRTLVSEPAVRNR
jgi:hypothetical protein